MPNEIQIPAEMIDAHIAGLECVGLQISTEEAVAALRACFQGGESNDK